MASQNKIYEADLYEPVQRHFSSLGYNVHAEVNDCDVVGVKDDTLVIIELKLSLNITLLMQAVKRQRITPNVYVAIPRPNYSLRKRKWRDLVHLMRKLELGLILVSFGKKMAHVELVHEPLAFDKKRSYRQSTKVREKLIQEVSSRKSNINIGGSHQIEVMTAYKENCVQVAYYLDELGEMSAKALRVHGTGEKTHSIMYNNYYQWFKRVSRGVYDLTDKGRKEYKQYPHIIKLYKQPAVE